MFHKSIVKAIDVLPLFAALGIAVALSLFNGAIASQRNDVDLEDVVASLSKKRREFERFFYITKVREYRPYMDRDVTRYSLAWTFPGKHCRVLSISVNTDDWEQGLNERKWSSATDNQVFQGRSAILRNQHYGAHIVRGEGKSKWSIGKIDERNPWKLPTPRFLGTLFLVSPYDWPIDQFLELKGVTVKSVEQDNDNKDLITVHCDARIASSESPFGEEFDGSWKMVYSISRELIMKQTFEDPGSRLVEEFQFENGERFPSRFTSHLRFDMEDGESGDINYEYTFLRIGNHQLPDSACTLTFFGLPEPPSVKKNSGDAFRFVMIAALGMAAVGIVILYLKRRASR